MESSPARSASRGGALEVESKLKDHRGKTRATVRTAGRANEISDDDAERGLFEAAQRDPRRFAELYENNFESVYAFIARRVGDRDHPVGAGRCVSALQR